jgi:hypothetical protein
MTDSVIDFPDQKPWMRPQPDFEDDARDTSPGSLLMGGSWLRTCAPAMAHSFALPSSSEHAVQRMFRFFCESQST